jgi:hypothetical protein
MSLIRLNQLHTEIMAKVDEKDVAIKQQIETSLQYTVGAEAPEAPSVGYRWFDTSTSLMKVWNGEGDGADWEITNANAIYLPGRNAVDALSTARKQITTGSGFLEFGGRIKSNKTINRSMLANTSVPRLAGIMGEGDQATKKYWFENFFLLNANGYSEETLDPSTGEVSEVLINGINISLKGTLPNSEVITDKKLMALNLPAAPSSVDELNRDEIVFLEIWREDITETGYVFPYGNVQYTGEDADGINTVQFNGEVGYCASFSGDSVVVTEIDDSGSETTTEKPKGRGWVWKNLQAVYKNSIAANYKHNLFVDGDKLVQIRYRVRVSKFSNQPATPLTNTTVLGYIAANDVTTVIKAQGKLGTLNTADDNYKILSPFNADNVHSLNGTYSTEYTTDLSHNGYVHTLPLSIVSRRNTGVFDTIFNPNGSARFRDGLRLVADYDDTDDIIGFALMDKENATLASSTTGSTWEDKYEIMMKWLFDRDTVLAAYDNASGFVIGGDMNSGISGRYNGLYYDEVNVVDVKDLRMDINKQLDLAFVLEQEFNKFILGDQRGWEQENHLHYWIGNVGVNALVTDANGDAVKDSNGVQLKGYGYVTELPIYYKMADGSTIAGIDADLATKVTPGYTTTVLLRSGVAPTTTEEANFRSGYSNIFTKRVQVLLAPVLDDSGNMQTDVDGNLVQKIIINDGNVYIDESTEIIIVSPKGRSSRKTQLFADIVGDPAGNSYKFSTAEKVADIASDAILENGNLVFTGQNYYVYRGTRKNKTAIESGHMDTSGNFKIDESNTNDWIDVTDKGGYSEGWRMYGNLGAALLTDEDGNSFIPRDVLSGLLDEEGNLIRRNTKFFKLSKPVSSIKKVIVTTDKRAGKKSFLTQITSTTEDANGNTLSIMDQVDLTPGTFGYDNSVYLTNNNTIAINWESYTDDAIIEIYYEVDSNPTNITTSSRVEILGDVWLGNSLYHNLGCKAISNMMDKVTIHDAAQGSKGAAKRIPLSTYLVNKGASGAVLNSEWSIITHADAELSGEGPAVKVLPYVTSVRGEMFLKLLYKELDKSVNAQGVAYTLDNSEFVVVDGETVDDNGGTGNQVKIGQRKIKLPYYFGDVV